MTTIRFQTLGAPGLEHVDGREAGSVLVQPKRTALLAYLACAVPRGAHRRDTLLGLFWPETGDTRARAALNTAVYQLRRSLGRDAVLSRGNEELALNPDRIECDALGFEEALDRGDLERALQLYGGEFLTGFHLPDAPEFERWLDAERVRLRERARSAAWTLSERVEVADATEAAVGWARRGLGIAPADERLARRLIELLDAAGDRAGALREYERFAARLASDYGVEPSAETRTAAEAIRAGGGAVDGEATVGSAAAASAGVGADGRSTGGERPDAAPGAGAGRDAGDGSGPAHRAGWSPDRRRSWHVAVGVLAAVGVVAAGLGAMRAGSSASGEVAPGSGRVLVVPLENRTGEAELHPLGALAADGIAEGLVETGLFEVAAPPTATTEDADWRALGAAAGAGLVISGSYYRGDDGGLRVQARVRDVDDGAIVLAVGPVRGGEDASAAGLESLRQRTAGGLALRRAPMLGGMPVTDAVPRYDAYREWVTGLEFSLRRDHDGAIRHFRAAARLDTTFLTPRVWAAYEYTDAGARAQADSLLGRLERVRRRLSRFDSILLDYVVAYRAGDGPRAVAIARDLAELAPRSHLAMLILGRAAHRVNRPAEAVRALSRIPRDLPRWDWFDAVGDYLVESYHSLGRYEDELEVVRSALAAGEGSLNARVHEVMALAALGRVREVDERVTAALALARQPNQSPFSVMYYAAAELRVHGDRAASRAILDRALPWLRTHPPSQAHPEAYHYQLAQALYLAGRWAEAAVPIRALIEANPGSIFFPAYLGRIAIRLGDSTEVRRIDAIMDAWPRDVRGAHSWRRARLAALRGDREEAVALLQHAFGQGFTYWIDLHHNPDWDSLRDYPPFQDVVRPKR